MIEQVQPCEVPMHYFTYGQKETDHLTARDPILGEVIRSIGKINRPVTPDLFESLVSSIVSQQISKKAYSTVWGRVRERVGRITPENILKVDREELKACGLSYRKTDWIRTGAEMVISKELDLNRLPELTDQELIKELTRLPGIGAWTAEMLLIFSLQRPDVLSWGDLAIQRGIRRTYGMEKLTRQEFEVIRQRLSPFNSVASLYFWEMSHEARPE